MLLKIYQIFFLFWFLLNCKQTFLEDDSTFIETVSSGPPCLSIDEDDSDCSILPYCPENFNNLDPFCYIITDPSSFPPKCPYTNTVNFKSYIDIIGNKDIPIWMPIRRDKTEGLGFLEWVEASDLFKSEFNENFYVEGSIKDKDCVVYYNSSYKALVSCSENYSAICAYKKLDQILDQICHTTESIEFCHQSDFNSDSKCYCLGDLSFNQSQFQKAEFQKSYQNRVYGSLTTDSCLIALEKTSNGTFRWSNSKQLIDYQYWSPNVVNDDKYIYPASSTSGWLFLNNSNACFIYEKEIEFNEPVLDLDVSGDKLVLNIINDQYLKRFNSNPLIYCFSTAGRLSLKYRYDYTTIKNYGNGTYEFDAHKSGPGYYWCEGVKFQNSEIISSEKIFINNDKNFSYEFVAIFSIFYIDGSYPLNGIFVEFLERILSITVTIDNGENSFYNYTARVMKIIDLDEAKSKALFNVHFTGTVSNKLPAAIPLISTEQEFERMKNMINETVSSLKEIQLVMVDFLSAYYCPEDSSDIYWPQTKIGQEAQALCFIKGLRVKRFCSGDFANGGTWSEIKDCEKPIYSTVTELLINLTKEATDPFNEIYQITERFVEFQPFDLFLVALLQNIYWLKADIEMFEHTLENIFKIDEKILERSQKEMRAMDFILANIDLVATFGDINCSRFVTMSESLTYGIVLLEDGTIQVLTDDHTIESIIDKNKNLEGAILLDSTNNFNNNKKIILKIFYDSTFFRSSLKSDRKIFGIVQNQTFVSFQVLYKSKNPDEKCAFWNYDLNSETGEGTWTMDNKTVYFPSTDSFILCNFNSSYSAVTVFSSKATQNVTQDLEDLLNSEDSPEKIINDLADLSDRFNEFSPEDVCLIAEILDKIKNSTELDLAALAHIVSNLHEVERQILSESQIKNLATDSVLYSVDEILKIHNYTKPINVTDNNFMIFITTLQDTDFTGLVLFNENQKLQTQNITGNVSLNEITTYDNIYSALYLPRKLKEQLGEASKIIVTVFSNDNLFNQNKSTFHYVGKIFGVVLQDLTLLLEPIAIVHNVLEENLKKSCVFWAYDQIEQITGVWQQDEIPDNMSSFSLCEFWHTTHFALLLLDYDVYDYEILDWITTINCGLSMFGLSCILLTAILFKRWRTNSGNQILLNFVFASILQICIFYGSSIVNKDANDELLCIFIGVVLHYSIISQFCWMFVIAVLQFKRFVEVLKGPPKHVLLKACLCGWILPCLPVVCVYFLDDKTYVNGNVGLCYPSGLGLYLGVWLPIMIIVAINLVIFMYIIYNVFHRRTECSDVSSDEVMFQWRLAVLLFFMLGLTWSFGFLSELNFGIVFVYVFSITATLQGFVMFLFFIVFNSNTRYLYTQCCRKTNKYY